MSDWLVGKLAFGITRLTISISAFRPWCSVSRYPPIPSPSLTGALMVAAASGRSAPSRGTPYDAYLAQGFRAAGLEPQPIRRRHVLAAAGRGADGVGSFVTALPSSMVRFSHQLPLKVIPVEFPVPSRSIGALTLKHRMVSPLAEIFLDCAHDLAKSGPGRRRARLRSARIPSSRGATTGRRGNPESR